MRSVWLILLMAGLAGCLSDDPAAPGSDEPGTDDPAYEVDFEGPVNGFGPTTATPTPTGGNGIWIHEDVLYWSNGGVFTYDVSDPLNVVPLGAWEEAGSRDVDVLEWQGRTYAVLAGSGDGVHVVDATDPSDLRTVGTFPLPSAGVHNLASVPGTPYIYSSGASGTVKAIDVLDITNPELPVIHTFPIPATMGGIPVESDGCHDISVRVDLGRAYCAGGGGTYTGLGGETFIWDITPEAGGPTNPTWVSMMDDPRLKYHHQAFVNKDGNILVINDEFIAPNCINVELPVVPNQLEPKVPFAAAWIYDVSDEANPVQLAYVQNPSGLDLNSDGAAPDANCGSHFGDLILGRDAFVMGWYQGGTMLVDFSTPSEPVVVDIAPALGSTWDAQYYKGHVYHSGSDLMVTQIV